MARAKQHIRKISKEAAAASLYRLNTVVLGTLSASKNVAAVWYAENSDTRIESISLVVKDAVSTSDTDYWEFQLTNRGTDGSGTNTLFATAPSTKVTGGSALVAYDARTLTPDQNAELAVGEVLSFVLTKSGSAANLTDACLVIKVRSDF